MVKFTYPRRPLMIYFALIIDIEKLGTREAEKSRILPKIRLQVGFWASLTPGIVSAVNLHVLGAPI